VVLTGSPPAHFTLNTSIGYPQLLKEMVTANNRSQAKLGCG
jgi:hypothetical protein